MSQALAVVSMHAAGAAVLALVVAFVSLKVRHASVAHVLWVVVLAKLLTPPFFELAVLPAEQPGQAYEESAVPETPEPTAVYTVREAAAPPVRDTAVPFPWVAALLAVLGTGTLAVLSLAAWRLARFRRQLGEAQEAGAVLAGRVAELSGRLGLRRPPRVRIVDRRISPLVLPRLGGADVVLPAALLARLEGEELDAVLVHELAHLRRRDHWVRGLELLATALFWWHPVLWWARRNLRRAEERCCDLWVAHVLPGCRRAYAEGLLKTLEMTAGVRTPLPATATGMDVREDMKERLTMILTERTPKILTPRHRWLLAATAVAVLVVVPTRAERAAGDEAKKTVDAEEERYQQERLELEGRQNVLWEEMRSLDLQHRRLDFEREKHQRDLEIERAEAEAQRLEAAGQAEEAERVRRELESQRAELELAQREHEREMTALEESAPLAKEIREVRLRSEELERAGDLAQAGELRRRLAEEERRMAEAMSSHQEERERLQAERLDQLREVLEKREQELSETGHEEQFLEQRKRMQELQEKARALQAEGVQARDRAETDRLLALVAELKAHQEEVLSRQEMTAEEKARIEAELVRLKERLAKIESRKAEEEE